MTRVLHRSHCATLDRAERRAEGRCTCGGGVNPDLLAADVRVEKQASGELAVVVRLLGTELALAPMEACMLALRLELASTRAAQHNAARGHANVTPAPDRWWEPLHAISDHGGDGRCAACGPGPELDRTAQRAALLDGGELTGGSHG